MVRGTEPNTRHRKRYCIALNALAKFTGVQVDLKPYSGNYSSTKVQPRDIPSDEEILHYYHEIVNPEWRYAYALLAAYGIRPNETPQLSCLVGQNGCYPTIPSVCLEWHSFEVATALSLSITVKRSVTPLICCNAPSGS
jgi:hypothetical protein